MVKALTGDLIESKVNMTRRVVVDIGRRTADETRSSRTMVLTAHKAAQGTELYGFMK